MPLDIANPAAAELRELEAQVEYAESASVTRTKAANLEKVRAAIAVAQAHRQRAHDSRRKIFDAATSQSLTSSGIDIDLTQLAGLDSAIKLYDRAEGYLRAVNLADATVDHAAAALAEAEALLAYEKARRATQEEKLVEHFANTPTGGAEFSQDIGPLLAAWTENVRRAEIILQDAQRAHRDANAARVAARAAYSQRYPEEN